MEAGKRTINDIFNGNRILEIPFFQRSYVWGEEQWDRLLEDMELVTETNKPYFLGSVILKQQITNSKKSVGDIRTVVDGQQRLTTLNIFFKVLCLKTGINTSFDRVFKLINNEIALEHNHNDIESFNKILSLDEDVELEGDNGIICAYNHIRKNIELAKIDFQNVLSNVMFVGIDLGVDEDEQQIFDTINSLGVRLTTAELLKNYFFGRDDLKSYEENWNDVFEKDSDTKEFWDREITAGRLKRNNIDLFFYSFLQIKIQDPKLRIRADIKKNLGKVEGLFESYKHLISEYHLSKSKLIQEIKNYAILYRKNIDYDVIDRQLTNEFGIERINTIIFGLENTTLLPYILFVLHKVPDYRERQKIFEYLESYIMKRMVCHASNKNYNRLFSEELIINNATTKEALRELIEKKSEKANYMPTDAELKTGFDESRLVNKQSAGILYLIESRIRNRAVHSTALLGLNRYSLEHLMPKRWENHWNSIKTEEERIIRNRKLLTLGNLTIITASLNSSIRDADWQTKKTGKKDKKGLNAYSSGLDTIKDFLGFDEWNEATIEQRADFLYEKARDIWK
jgi:Protein of unknown function DUF262/Protein of unknown function (DUF1524)